MVVEDGGKQLNVVFYGSTTILPGVRLINNPKYPLIVDDFTRTFAVLQSLPCDVFLAPHGLMFGLNKKAQRAASGKNRIRSSMPTVIELSSRDLSEAFGNSSSVNVRQYRTSRNAVSRFACHVGHKTA